MGDRDENHEKKKSPILSNKKIALHLGVKRTVAKRFDECAYRAGLLRHELVERAIDYAIKHKLDMRKVAEDEKVRAFLSAPKNDYVPNYHARLYPDMHLALEKVAKKQNLSKKEYAQYATAYYVIYVLKLTTPESQLKQT